MLPWSDLDFVTNLQGEPDLIQMSNDLVGVSDGDGWLSELACLVAPTRFSQFQRVNDCILWQLLSNLNHS